jgi:CxxC motif-containing protein (DUF1111 family)
MRVRPSPGRALATAALAAAAAACGASNGGEPERQPAPGDPLPGLTSAELARFEAGRALFNRVFTPDEGLGPFFNENQCSACHTDPASGGTGEQLVIRATRFEPPDRCDLLPEYSGENVQTNATPLLRARGITRREVPPHATHVGRLATPFLFGLGLVEAVPEAVLLAAAAPAAGGGIAGRPGRDTQGRFARFGRKADHATLEDFTVSALLHEMGLTSPQRPREGPFEGGPMPPELDPAPDPEVDAETVALLTDFVRLLAPLPRRIPDDPDVRRDIAEGERLFTQVGCTACHTPSFETGPNPSAALDRRPVEPYSDFLLHDLGLELAGPCAPGATPTEHRTAPLMGLGYRRHYLHDFRAVDLYDVIRLHGGAAVRARAAFQALDEVQQAALIRFLQSL